MVSQRLENPLFYAMIAEIDLPCAVPSRLDFFTEILSVPCTIMKLTRL